MDAHNVLQQKKKATFTTLDPGASKMIEWDRDEQVVELKPASGAAETRGLLGPTKSGLKLRLDCTTFATSSDCTVTVYDSSGATTGTIAFSAAGQWANLESFCNASGNNEWRVMAAYGCVLTTIPSTYSSSDLITPLIANGLTASGSAANDFSASTGTFKTSTGLNTLGGKMAQKVIATPVAAAASPASLGSANIVVISSDGATKKVKLLTGVAGDVIYLINSSSTAAELVPATGGTLNGLAANAAVVIPASKGVICICTAADTWTVYDLTALATAA